MRPESSGRWKILCVSSMDKVTRSPLRTGEELGVEIRPGVGVSGMLSQFSVPQFSSAVFYNCFSTSEVLNH